MNFQDYQNTHELLKEVADNDKDKIAYKWFVGDNQIESVTWEEYYEKVKKAAKSLMALGVKKNDKINIISYTCFEWVLTDYAALSIGACTVGIYHSNLAQDCKYIINHSDGVILFVEDETQLDKIMGIRDEIPNIKKIIMFRKSSTKNENVLSFEDFMECGKDISDAEFEKRTKEIQPEDSATLVYTSGTTGLPKGAELTHGNMTFTAQSVFGSTQFWDKNDTFLFLPLAHVFARTCVLLALISRSPLTFARSMDTIVDDIAVAKPVWFASVPRIYEKIHAKIVGGVEAKGGIALKLFGWAMAVGSEVSDRKRNNKNAGPLLKAKYAIANKLIFSKIQGALGGNVRWCISGAAPLNNTIGEFFHTAGILIVEGCGMSENVSFTNVNRYDNYRFGWVGQAGPGVEQKIGDDGEIMFRGKNVMKGYYKMPEETSKTITKDGWLLTGDLGEIDNGNFLRITGRKKDLIITSGGKNIAPSLIEGEIATSKYINQVCVIGDRKKYLSALITLDPDNIAEWAKTNTVSYDSVEALVNNEKVIELIENEVAEKNKKFASFETIKKITILPEFTIETNTLTPTMKIKRNIVFESYKDTIESMYEE